MLIVCLFFGGVLPVLMSGVLPVLMSGALPVLMPDAMPVYMPAVMRAELRMRHLVGITFIILPVSMR